MILEIDNWKFFSQKVTNYFTDKKCEFFDKCYIKQIEKDISLVKFTDVVAMVDELHGYHVFRSLNCKCAIYLSGAFIVYVINESVKRAEIGSSFKYKSDISDDLIGFLSGRFHDIDEIVLNIKNYYSLEAEILFEELISMLLSPASLIEVYRDELLSLSSSKKELLSRRFL